MVAYEANWKQGNYSEHFCKVPLRSLMEIIRVRLDSKTFKGLFSVKISRICYLTGSRHIWGDWAPGRLFRFHGWLTEKGVSSQRLRSTHSLNSPLS